jgi:hypothetical protein
MLCQPVGELAPVRLAAGCLDQLGVLMDVCVVSVHG